jgi:hypothetical protein
MYSTLVVIVNIFGILYNYYMKNRLYLLLVLFFFPNQHIESANQCEDLVKSLHYKLPQKVITMNGTQ